MFRIPLPRDLAKLVAGLTLLAIMLELRAFDGSFGTVSAHAAPWEAFALLGCSLGIALPRAILPVVGLLALAAVLTSVAGIGSLAPDLLFGLVGFGVVVAFNGWIDGFRFVPSSRSRRDLRDAGATNGKA